MSLVKDVVPDLMAPRAVEIVVPAFNPDCPRPPVFVNAT